MFYQHFKKIPAGNPQLSTITIWSDGCGYQNRRTAVANMYYHLSLEMNVKVFQKYLVSGHTQMECDSVHSTSERHISKTDVYTPHEYALLVKTACRKRPYAVQVIDHSEVFALPSNAYFSSVRPGKKAGDPVVTDIKALCYEDGKVAFKLSHSENEFSELPQRIGPMEAPVYEQKKNYGQKICRSHGAKICHASSRPSLLQQYPTRINAILLILKPMKIETGKLAKSTVHKR